MSGKNNGYKGPERRHFVRIPFEAMIRYKVSKLTGGRAGDFQETHTKNISTSGILVKSREHFSAGTILELEFSVPTEEGYAEIQILGKVMRVVEVPGGEYYDNGIAFYKIKRKDEKAISNLVDYLEEEDAQA